MNQSIKIKYSVVIPTFNRAVSLEACLNSVSKQTTDKECYEIIIVDDGSTDNTKDVVEKFSQNLFPNICYIYQENAGCASARNTGIKKAIGHIIFFTDDDCTVPEYWMEELLKGFEKYPQTYGVGGWYSAEKEELRGNQFARIFSARIRLNAKNYEDYSVLSNNNGVNLCWNTANVAYRSEVFEKVGLFDEYTKKTAMIDYELRMRIMYAGLYSYYIPLIILHTKKVNVTEFISASFRYGIADYYLSTKFPEVEKTYRLVYFFQYLYEIKNADKRVSLLYYSLYIFIRLFGTQYARLKKIKAEKVFPWEEVPRVWLREFSNGKIQKQEFYSTNKNA